MVAAAGALEITVHGWDIAVACGSHRPVPPGLAAVLLPIAPLFITPGTRAGLFADPVPVPGGPAPVTSWSPSSAASRASPPLRAPADPGPGQRDPAQAASRRFPRARLVCLW